jgi:hypothetical protein
MLAATSMIESTMRLALPIALPALLASALAAPLGATSRSGGVVVLPFPMQRASDAPEARMAPDAQAMGALEQHGRVLMQGVLLGDGSIVDLELERIPLERVVDPSAWHVDGVPRPLGDMDQTLWSGKVVGQPESDVYLSLSPLASRGWVWRRGDWQHLASLEGTDSPHLSCWVSEARLASAGFQPRFDCRTPAVPGAASLPPAPLASNHLATVVRTCRVSVECDWQLTQRFGGDAQAAANYVIALYGALSQRFYEQVDAVLQLAHLGTYSTASDPWQSQENGAGLGGLLDEFRIAWTNALPGGGALGHFLSGADLGGGLAYVDVLCNGSWGFGASSGINFYGGQTPLPVQQGPFTWDYYVVAHEMGHNFGSLHTHDYCPPLDQCAAGSCSAGGQCSTSGTIMSYCHTCGAGMANISPYFHPTTAQIMKARVQASGCMPAYCTMEAIGYCPLSPNSVDPFGAQIGWQGSLRLSQGAFMLETTSVPPNTPCMYIFGPNQTQAPFGNGYRCVASPVLRLPRFNASPWGDALWMLDFASYPGSTIAAGAPQHFQLWYRNSAAGGAGFNFSDGLRVAFCP